MEAKQKLKTDSMTRVAGGGGVRGEKRGGKGKV